MIYHLSKLISHLYFVPSLISLNAALEVTSLKGHADFVFVEINLENHGELFLVGTHQENHGELFLVGIYLESHGDYFWKGQVTCSSFSLRTPLMNHDDYFLIPKALGFDLCPLLCHCFHQLLGVETQSK